MSGQPPSEREGQSPGFAYFMIRVQRHVPPDPHRVSGVIERLGTGEKWSFEAGEELLHLLNSWPDPASNMQRAPTPGNPSG